MTRSRSSNRDSRQGSDDSDDDSDAKSPISRGRSGKSDAEVEQQIHDMVQENSRR
jgi:hypothetical protein